MNDASQLSPAWRARVKETHDGHVIAAHNSHNASRRGQWTSEFRAWRQMRSRCYDENMGGYENYGGRGITVCARWVESFENFLEDMGEKPSPQHSLDRRSNDGNYEPSNCRWATKLEQDNNRRTNRILEFRGQRKTMSQWARELNINPVTIFSRLDDGWSVERALGTAVARRARMITHDGQSKSLAEWARLAGISSALLAWRIKTRWDFTAAIRTRPHCDRAC